MRVSTDREKTVKSIFRFFAERNTLAYLLTVMLIFLGLNTLTFVKRDSFPNVDFGEVHIYTTYPGASPEDVELNVTNKIEEELESVTEIDHTASVSMENVSVVRVVLDPDAGDQENVKTEIREAVGRVTDLPEEVTESPYVTEIDTTHIPVIEVGLSGDVSYRELREHAKLFEKKLKALPGVAWVERFGYRAREIQVEVSPEAMYEYQISMREIISAIQARNIRITAGSFESFTSEKNIMTLAQFRDPLEVGDVVVRSTFEGPLVKVKDLAIVKDDFEDERVLSRVSGERAISFMVHKTESADVIRTADEVKKLVEKEKEHLPDNVRIFSSTDFSHYVRSRLKVVLLNALIGLGFVLLLLSAFLNIRVAFWVALGIPVALLGTIFLMPLAGTFLESISLSAMIMVIGIVVDDAIIVAENICRRRELGASPVDAAVEGLDEVFRPVLTTVLTTFLAFAPMFFMAGILGKFVYVIPLVISLALFISMAEVIVALPAHLVPGISRRTGEMIGRGWFSFFRNRYGRVVLRFLRYRYVLVLLFLVLLGAAGWYAKTYMKFVLFTSKMAEQFYIIVELPTGTTLQATSEKVAEIEEVVAALPPDELVAFHTRVGTNPFLGAESENYAFLSIDLTAFNQRSRNAEQIVEELKEKTGEFDKAVECYRMGIEVDPLAEKLYQSLMVCLQRLGRIAEALATYRRCKKNLRATLDIEPSDRTEAIHRSLQANSELHLQAVCKAKMLRDSTS